ncbi:MAG: UDP-3-O-acyl-N-acetylglucosamine deacetylase [Myxococcales bacterium]|nr:UDP-3-O-acyl-N-acetylglucosamine deacetylase [Myxococcales bacterium]
MGGLRTTLARPVTREGIGLHTGQPVKVHLRPRAFHDGRVFVRTDRSELTEVKANFECVCDTTKVACLRSPQATIVTVEYLLAALAVLKIDDLTIEIDGPEMPILDGSAAPWIEALEAAGRRSTSANRRSLRVVKPFVVKDGIRSMTWLPAEQFCLDVQVGFPGHNRSSERWSGPVTPGVFSRELAPARTFGFESEQALLRRRGLIRGASWGANAILLRDDQSVAPARLRFADEVVRNKALEALGDIALLEVPIIGKLQIIEGCHAFHIRALRQWLSAQDVWAWAEYATTHAVR